MKKLLILVMGIGLSLGLSNTVVAATEDPQFMATYISVNECYSNELLQHVRLVSDMRFEYTPDDKVELESVTYSVNDKVFEVEVIETVNENTGWKQLTYHIDACEVVEQNITDQQRSEIQEFNDQINPLVRELEEHKVAHYNDDTYEYDTPENAEIGFKLQNEIRTLKSNLRMEIIEEFLLYKLNFVNDLDQVFTFSYFVDFQGVSFEGNKFPMDFKDRETVEPDEPELPNETDEGKEPEDVVEEVEKEVEEVDVDHKSEEVEVENKAEAPVTPNTSINNSNTIFIIIFIIGLVSLLGLKKKEI